ncbi:BolA family protein [Pigmentiphaga litoralis]|uniref:BolA protein n=1 Tax=Pigmentiphaga litoralis TaxID=516702 RepID=A0A7Y9IWS8_9BURK|nr:BolA family protein [Pigmentiphaga litoralis]NYE21863.1 BolA protein [Pigmentiphaga litoralis]NYE84522.1 BolA protein [Pigmentiphaga litoralis]
MTAARVATIRSLLGGLDPQALDVIDESHLHAGHAGAAGGAGHFRVRVVSDRFTGLSRVSRHRLVYDRLKDLMPDEVHALAITALTSQENSDKT